MADASWQEDALALLAQGDTAVARSLALGARDAAPAAAWLILGLAERQAGDRVAARAAFTEAARAAPHDERPLLEQAEEALALGDPQDARRLLHAAATVAPASPWPQERLGELAMLARRPAEARAHFAAAAALAPRSLRARLGQAEALAAEGDDAAAAAVLAAAEAALGSRPETTAHAIALLRERGHWPAARRAARAAIAAAPRETLLWREAAGLEWRLASPADFAAWLDAAPAPAAADRAHFAGLRALAAEAAGDMAGAARAAEAALDLHPEEHAARAVIARVALLQGALPAARAAIVTLAEREAAMNRMQGRLPDAGMSFLGTVLAEFELDAPLLTRLATLPDAPEPLLELAREHPDSTLLALRLLAALGAGAPGVGSSGGAPAPGAPPVPPRLGQFWEGTPPPLLATLMAGWAAMNPGLVVTRMDDAAARGYLREAHPPAVLQAFRRARDPRMRADLLRLAWLADGGGWWADADVRALQPVARLAPRGAGLVVSRGALGALTPKLLGAAPGEPVIRRALDLLVAALNRGDSEARWLLSGPGLLSRAAAQVVAEARQDWPLAWRRMALPAPRDLHQVVAPDCVVPVVTG